MALKEEAKSVFDKLLGSVVSEQLKNFDDPEKYPKDFLDECTDFLGKFIGVCAAKKKMDPLYRKYIK
ncbi:MAG: hypothetical protein NTU57_00895 [Candidatus Aenigmarchaeota archaeon]|nr:hypothetical protein [Candidatus Aenigmarchaeota archaeon]